MLDTKQVSQKDNGGTCVGQFQVARCTEHNTPSEATPWSQNIRCENFALYERPPNNLHLFSMRAFQIRFGCIFNMSLGIEPSTLNIWNIVHLASISRLLTLLSWATSEYFEA